MGHENNLSISIEPERQEKEPDSSFLRNIGPIQIHGYRDLKARWRRLDVLDDEETGLAVDWRNQYRFLFAVDPDLDWALFKNQGVTYGRHFNEWLSALVLHHVTRGFYALNQKFEFIKHKEKREKLNHLSMPASLRSLLNGRGHGAQCPDLLMYDSHDPSKWFFCDAKGPGDRIQKNQIAFWTQLAKAAQKPVYVLSIWEADSLTGSICDIGPGSGIVVRDDELKNLAMQLASVI